MTTGLFSGKTYAMPMPLLFNLPTVNYFIFERAGYPFKLETCLQWYYFDFEAGVSQETIDFVGVNPGLQGENQGLLGTTMDNFTCSYRPYDGSNKYQLSVVPFFKRPSSNVYNFLKT